MPTVFISGPKLTAPPFCQAMIFLPHKVPILPWDRTLLGAEGPLHSLCSCPQQRR